MDHRPAPRSASRAVPCFAVAVAVGVGGTALACRRPPADPHLAALRPLVDAVGERRFLEPRLTGGFRHGPLVERKRADPSIPATEELALYAAAGEAEKRAQRDPSAPNRLALAVARALLRDVDGSLESLLALTEESPHDARLLSDLAAAYLARASSTGRAEDLLRGLECASQARALDARLPEAAFNRALALEAVGLRDAAARAWNDFLALPDEEPWRQEAARRLQKLSPPSGPPVLSERLPAVQETFELEIIPALLAGGEAARSEAERLGEEFLAVTGDYSLRDVSASFAQPVPPARRAALQDYVSGRRAYKEQHIVASRDHFRRALRGGLPAPLEGWTRFYLLVARYWLKEPVAARAEADALERSRTLERYPLLLGRVHWMQGLTALVAARPEEAVERYGRALQIFRSAHDLEDAVAVRWRMAEALDYAGEPATAWQERLEAVRAHSRASSADRLESMLVGLTQAALRTGLDHTAAAAQAEAAALVPRLGSPAARAEVHLNGAKVLARLAPEQARLALRQAGVELKGITDPFLLQRLRTELLVAWASQPPGDHAADDEARVAIDGLEGLGLDLRVPEVLLVRARLQLSRGQTAGARADLTDALDRLQAFSARRDWNAVSGVEGAHALAEEVAGVLAGEPGSLFEGISVAERVRSARRLGPEEARALCDSLSARIGERDAVAFLLGSRESLGALLLTRSGPQLVTLGPDASASPVDAFLESTSSHAPAGGWSRLWVVPVAELDLAAGAYPQPRTGSGGPAPAVAYCDSLTSLERFFLDPAPPARERLSALAPSGAGDLPATTAEVRSIAGLYPRAAVHTGEDASRDRFLQALGDADVVHFAGHLVANPLHPGSSRILFGRPGAAGATSLRLDELGPRVAVRADLLVLAACSGGDGGRPLAGLPRSFAQRFASLGVRFVVAATRPVEDRTAAAVMIAFHRELRRQGDPVAALAAAQREALPRSPSRPDLFRIYVTGRPGRR